MESTKRLVTRKIHAFSLPAPGLAVALPAIVVLGIAMLTIMSTAGPAQAQASWVGDVIVDGEPSNLWADCLPCTELTEPPNTNWSTDRIPGDDGPLGDPNTGAVIGPDFVVDHNGGTLDLSTLDVQGGLIVGGLINISDSATINNIDLESGGALAGPGPVTLTGSGTWNGALRAGGGVTNQATLTAETGDLETDLVNSATLIVNPSLDFRSTPSTLTNNGNILLNTDTALNNNSDILDGSGAANLLLNHGTIAKSGADLSVIEAPGNHAGGLINASDGTLRFFRNDWQFSGGSMSVSNGGIIELTGNVDHRFTGTPGISGTGTLLLNMSTFGTATFEEDFEVDLNAPGVRGANGTGLVVSGLGARIANDAVLTSRRGGEWNSGLIAGDTAPISFFLNEAPVDQPFVIVPTASKRLEGVLFFLNDGALAIRDSFSIQSPSDMFSAGYAIVEEPGHTIQGTGALTNQGVLEFEAASTDLAQSELHVRFNMGGSEVLVQGGHVVRLTGGGSWSGNTRTELNADALNSMLEFDNGTFEFDNGEHRFEGSPFATIQINGAVLENAMRVVFQGPAVRFQSGSLSGPGLFTNLGVFLWTGGTMGIQDPVVFENEGLGSLRMSGFNAFGGVLFNRGLVTQLGTLATRPSTSIQNYSEWDLLNAAIAGDGAFVNVDLLVVEGASTSEVSIDFANFGKVQVQDSSVLQLSGPVSNIVDGVLESGTWIIRPNAELILPGPLTTIGPGAVIEGLNGLSDAQAIAEILGGEVSTHGDLLLFGSLELSNGGTLRVDGATLQAPGGIENGAPESVLDYLSETEQLVINRGPQPAPMIVTPLLNNWARLGPGGENAAGPFNLTGDLVLQPQSTLEIDVGGLQPIDGHDHVDVVGSIAAGGEVLVQVLDDFYPAVGDEYIIAVATEGISGEFAGIINANRPDIAWRITETAGDVRLSVDDVEIVYASGFED